MHLGRSDDLLFFYDAEHDTKDGEPWSEVDLDDLSNFLRDVPLKMPPHIFAVPEQSTTLREKPSSLVLPTRGVISRGERP